jgi:hypothetical protein
MPSSTPTLLTSSLNKERSGSTSDNFIVSGKPPTLWWDLIVLKAHVPKVILLHRGKVYTLTQEIYIFYQVSLLIKYLDKGTADHFPLFFRIGFARQFGIENVLLHPRLSHSAQA